MGLAEAPLFLARRTPNNLPHFRLCSLNFSEVQVFQKVAVARLTSLAAGGIFGVHFVVEGAAGSEDIRVRIM